MRGPSPTPVEERCKINGCDEEDFRRGRCEYHYEKYKKHYHVCCVCDLERDEINFDSEIYLCSMMDCSCNPKVCDHWFCSECVDKFEFAFCPRCGKNVEDLLD
jgi:hypothetical protein